MAVGHIQRRTDGLVSASGLFFPMPAGGGEAGGHAGRPATPCRAGPSRRARGAEREATKNLLLMAGKQRGPAGGLPRTTTSAISFSPHALERCKSCGAACQDPGPTAGVPVPGQRPSPAWETQLRNTLENATAQPGELSEA